MKKVKDVKEKSDKNKKPKKSKSPEKHKRSMDALNIPAWEVKLPAS